MTKYQQNELKKNINRSEIEGIINYSLESFRKTNMVMLYTVLQIMLRIVGKIKSK